jgi:hypothetical protein
MANKKTTKKMKKSKSKSKKTSLLSKSRFSLRGILLFTVAFAIIGGYLLIRSFAAVITNPTHLVDAQWNFPNSSTSNYTLTSLSVDMAPQTDPTPDGYFYAAEFYYSGNTGYLGLQDEGIDSTGKTVPKTASITIYGATSSTPASGIEASCGNPSGEGQQCNLNDVYNWIPKHNYRFFLTLQTADNGAGSEVWAASFADVTTNTTIQLGTLNIPTTWLYLGHAIIMFHERFSGDTTTCSNTHPSFVVFSNVTANNGTVTGTTDSSFRSGTTSCTGYLDNHYTNGAIYSGYGPNISCYDPTLSSTATNCTTGTTNTPTTPVVTISSPSNGAHVKHKTNIQSTATDTAGITQMQLYIDGSLVTTSTSSSLGYSWNTNTVSSGSHTILVKAYDAANNVGQSSITVTK